MPSPGIPSTKKWWRSGSGRRPGDSGGGRNSAEDPPGCQLKGRSVAKLGGAQAGRFSTYRRIGVPRFHPTDSHRFCMQAVTRFRSILGFLATGIGQALSPGRVQQGLEHPNLSRVPEVRGGAAGPASGNVRGPRGTAFSFGAEMALQPQPPRWPRHGGPGCGGAAATARLGSVHGLDRPFG